MASEECGKESDGGRTGSAKHKGAAALSVPKQPPPRKVEERMDTVGTRGKWNGEECPRSVYTLVPATSISLNKSEDQRQEHFIQTSRKRKRKRRLKNSHKSDQKIFF